MKWSKKDRDYVMSIVRAFNCIIPEVMIHTIQIVMDIDGSQDYVVVNGSRYESHLKDTAMKSGGGE